MAQSLFRNIRKKLLNEGKLVRYLTYAIGEILLIVVGIMLALQLNNWNEDQKAQAEFDEYIVQLREDVRVASEVVEITTERLDRFIETGAYVFSFLKISDYQPEDLERFEAGLRSFEGYTKVQVNTGLLGDLLNGNYDIIGRDRSMAQAARRMESGIERERENAEHIYSQIDLASDRLNNYRGMGLPNFDMPPEYDIERLKNTEEFRYTAVTILRRKNRLSSIYSKIDHILESFLTILEEYE